MIVDANLIAAGGLSAAGVAAYQTVTGTGSILSTNAIDLSQARDVGAGTDLWLRVLVGAAFAGVTAVEFQAIQADDAALGTNVNVIASTGAIPVANLTAGKRLAAGLNDRLGTPGQRYLGVRFILTGTGTAGTVFADFGVEVQDSKAYPTSSVVL